LDAYIEEANVQSALQDSRRFWNVLRERRANGLGDEFWRPPKPIFTPKSLAVRLGLYDERGNLTPLSENILLLDNWEDAKGAIEACYRRIAEEKEKAAAEIERRKQALFREMIDQKRLFKSLQVIPYAQWKWPWIYISKIYYKKPEIYRSQYDSSPYVYFPTVFKADMSNKQNWKLLREIGWVNELGEVRVEIVYALKERERKLLEAGGIISSDNDIPNELEQLRKENSGLNTADSVG
jgi:hypothetical protein